MSKTYILTLLGLSILSVGFGMFFGSLNSNSELEFVNAERKTLTQEVVVTGTTKPVQSLELAFQNGGIVRSVTAKVGDAVRLGQILARVDSSELLAKLSEAEANIKAQEAKLAELKAGTRGEELQIYLAKKDRAEETLNSAKQNLINELVSAYAKADDAVRSRVDQFFANPQTTAPQLTLLVAPQLKIDLELQRRVAEIDLEEFLKLAKSAGGALDIKALATSAKIYLNSFAGLLNNAALAVNSTAPTPTLMQTTLNAWRADIANARTSINASISSLSAALQNLKTAENDLNIAERELALKQAGATFEQIQAQEAAVLQARAQAQNIQAQIGKTVLRSPINGVVSKQDAKLGQIAAANQPLITVITPNQLKIEANIPEVDIGAIKLGDAVTVNFDAFTDTDFKGTVAFIDPAETIIDGVVNFKVKITLNDADPRFKSGLTASLAIQTISKADALALPQFAILENDEGIFVRKARQDGTIIDTPVELGIRSRDGYVEILSGLADLEKVVNIGKNSE